MKIEFTTKEESNQKQLEEFLALTPDERVRRFFELSRRVMRFQTKHQNTINPKNFIIERKSK